MWYLGGSGGRLCDGSEGSDGGRGRSGGMVVKKGVLEVVMTGADAGHDYW